MPFQSGASGNPNGRPRGSGSRQQLFNDMVLPHKAALIEKAISMAKNGDHQMLKLLLERILPAKQTDEPVAFELPDNLDYGSREEIANNILKAVAEMSMTPDVAKKIFMMLASFRDI